MNAESESAKSLAEQMELFRDNSRDFFAARKDHIDSTTVICQQQCKLNENFAAFYEKVMLFDGAAIVFSFTLLNIRNVNVAVHPHAVFWFIGPAWILLLLSMYFASRCMGHFHTINNLLVQHTAKMASNYYLQLTAVAAKKLYASVPDALGVDLAGAEDGPESLLRQGVQDGEDLDKIFAQANQVGKGFKLLSGTALLCTMISVVLLCVFAVTNLLP